MYRIGDVLRGLFPRSDGGHGPHYGLIVRVLGPYAVVLIGSSKRVARATTGGQVVFSPKDVGTRIWEATGLPPGVAGGFDFATGRLTTVAATPGRFKERLIGSVMVDPKWAVEVRSHLPITDERIRQLIAAR